MWSSSSTRNCRCPFSNSILHIPSPNYTHAMSVGTSEPSPPNAEFKVMSIELRVQEWYKMYVEPTRGCSIVTMEENYFVSPKFTCNFKFPLFLSTCKFRCDSCINGELDKLPISLGLAQYLKPFIVNGIVESVQVSLREFKLIFDVKVVKIDLINYQDCNQYRQRGLFK